jgi:hypothetical protein
MSAYKQSIRVIYPKDGGRIALRTDENWDVDLGAVSRRGHTAKFQIETERPYFYFKAVLIRDGATLWSRGENCLAIATSGHDEIAWAARSPIPFQFLFGKLPVFSKPRRSRIKTP